jgi:hypothetical protein
MSTKNRILKLEKEKAAFVEELLKAPPMLRGTFGVAYRKCGKSNCWCVSGDGHPYNRITWSEGARSRTKNIPSQDTDWAQEFTENYRRFKKTRRTLRELERDLKELLDQLEDQLVRNARKQRPYF